MYLNDLHPIIKLAGGKRQLLQEILPLIGSTYSTYVEPFVGGAAVLLALQPSKAVINDSNEELINLYKVVRDDPIRLINELKNHQKNNSEEYYYFVRALDRDSSFHNLSNTERAARVVYLNRTCFNGLYRVNKKGQFNVPYGNYDSPKIVDEKNIKNVSNYLNSNDITIKLGDYRKVLQDLDSDSFVYFDPPYLPISKTASFTSYTKDAFGLEEQIVLRDECNKLRKKGIRLLLSNSDCDEIKELYKDYIIRIVDVSRNINSNANGRKGSEVLVYYE